MRRIQRGSLSLVDTETVGKHLLRKSSSKKDLGKRKCLLWFIACFLIYDSILCLAPLSSVT
jgi:hypothetical protein